MIIKDLKDQFKRLDKKICCLQKELAAIDQSMQTFTLKAGGELSFIF